MELSPQATLCRHAHFPIGLLCGVVSGPSGGYVRVQFWGARGSIAKPGPSTARYGGNTSCIHARSARGTLVVVDRGTGGHSLGQNLVSAVADGPGGHNLV